MPILASNSVEFISHSPEQTRRLGLRLGTLLDVADLICLAGDMGAGKTTFVQGLAQGWGSIDSVSSPTYVLVNQYRNPVHDVLHHMDCYRLMSAAEAWDLDMDVMLEQGALVIEWPDKIREVLPNECIWVELSWVDEEKRKFMFHATGRHYEELLTSFRKSAFGG
ncbi:MAG: tRNA (adenosine(37)-N6)-threonylcarbamoyltransferase complex ATPase subunit type 1 TsaE [Anaerolineaceae bacterium]|nr:tRNA (adenosine(37)-N6)-threonylcarbamoyltransferase complex ATPase subunit type 1 TsaE [Anaerolineaceae bacterium]